MLIRIDRQTIRKNPDAGRTTYYQQVGHPKYHLHTRGGERLDLPDCLLRYDDGDNRYYVLSDTTPELKEQLKSFLFWELEDLTRFETIH